MKLTAESTVVNDGKLNTNIDNAQTSADNAQTTANTATTKADNAQGTANTAVTKADNAQSTANTAVTKADNAQATANQAKQVADNTAQYFWFTSSGSDTGAHISEKTQAQFVSNPSGGNLLARSNGIAVRDGLTELATFGATSATIGNSSNGNVLIDTDSVDIRDGSTVLATFGADGLQIGQDTEKHIGITSQDFTVFEEDGSAPFSVSTAGSKVSATKGAGTAINGSSASYHEWYTQIYLRGTLSNNRVYFGTSTSAYPTTFSTITVNGIKCSAQWQTRSVVYVEFENTTSTRTYVAYRYTDEYYNTSVKVNDASLNNKFISTLLKDDIGSSKDTLCYIETYGHIAMLHIGVYNTSSISAKGTIYSGTLMSHLPEIPTGLVGVYNGAVLIGRVNSDGHISVWNSTGASITSSDTNTLTLSATYIFK